MTIAFTGATGQFGTLLADELLARTSADNIVALARNPEKASNLRDKGIEVRAFDYDQPDMLTPALERVDRLLLISGSAIGQRIPQHEAVIRSATEAGVGFVAYTSFLHAETASIIAVAPEHQATEKLLAEAPFDVALLRNGWYTENFESLVKQAVSTGTLLGSTGDGRISSVPRKDLAEAAAIVLTAETAQPATYELASDESWTLSDLNSIIGEASGKSITLNNVSSAEHRSILLDSGVPEGMADFLVGTDQAIAAGELEDKNPGTLSKLIGHPTTSLAEVVQDWI
ncbi:SDR family oxidoreductase [Ancrocorticia populi]|uniref:SDR family oxidoreductase n=1 Tax=Ancrocorticia populi TaxID=2175228 RepID=UPI003F93F5C4